MMLCAQKDKGRAWDKNSPQMNQGSNIKNKSGLIELFSQMPDCKSPYLTASRLPSQYGRKKLIIKIFIAFTSTAQNSPELDKNNQSNYYRRKKYLWKICLKTYTEWWAICFFLCHYYN